MDDEQQQVTDLILTISKAINNHKDLDKLDNAIIMCALGEVFIACAKKMRNDKDSFLKTVSKAWDVNVLYELEKMK